MTSSAVDVAVLAAVAAAAVFGALSGALRQLAHLAAAVLGWLAARHLGPPVAAGLSRRLPEPVARGAAGLLLFVGTYAVAGLALRLLIARRGPGHAAGSPADRGCGAILGAVQSGLGLWAVLSALVLLAPLEPRWALRELRGSDLAGLAREHNLLAHVRSPMMDRLRRLLRAARDPAEATKLRMDGDVRELLDDPRVRLLLSDGPRPGDGSGEALLSDPRALDLLQDAAFLQRLERTDGRVLVAE